MAMKVHGREHYFISKTIVASGSIVLLLVINQFVGFDPLRFTQSPKHMQHEQGRGQDSKSVWSWATTSCPQGDDNDDNDRYYYFPQSIQKAAVLHKKLISDIPADLLSKLKITTTGTTTMFNITDSVNALRSSAPVASHTSIRNDPPLNSNFCPMTVQIRIERKCPYWILQTIDENGDLKTVGGDEFYITYTDEYSIHTQPEYYKTIDRDMLPEKYINKVPLTSELISSETGNVTQTATSASISVHPTAIADITDYNNGTYRLDFITSPLNGRLHRLKGSGVLTVQFQYICGIGKLNPPIKRFFKKDSIAGSSSVYMVNRQNDGMMSRVNILPPLTIFQPPSIAIANANTLRKTSSASACATGASGVDSYKRRIVDLSKYRYIIPVGDSLMKNFVRPRNIKIHKNVGQPLNTTTIQKFISLIQLRLVPGVLGTNNDDGSHPEYRVALLLGSSTWDLLSNDDRPMMQQASLSISNSTRNVQYENINNNNKYWDDHITACEELIKFVRHEYPTVDILWKSPSSLHIHIPIKQLQKKVSSIKLKRQFGGMSNLNNRLRYMSSSRSYILYTKQKELMQRLNVTFLDIYQASFLSADHTFIGDGRHYLPYFNTMIVNWFFSTSYIDSLWNHHMSTHHRDSDSDREPRMKKKTHSSLDVTPHDDKYFLIGYYFCPLRNSPTTGSRRGPVEPNSHLSETVAVDLVNLHVVAMVLNRTVLLKYHDPTEDTTLGSGSKQAKHLLSEEQCNRHIWNEKSPPSWFHLYDDWVLSSPSSTSTTSSALKNLSLPTPPKSHNGLSNRDRWLTAVRSNTPMGNSELRSAGYQDSITIIHDLFKHHGKDMFHGMLMNELFPPATSTECGDHSAARSTKTEPSDAITIALGPSWNNYISSEHNETGISDCFQTLLRGTGLHGQMKCHVLTHSSMSNDKKLRATADRFNCSVIAVPSLSDKMTRTTQPKEYGAYVAPISFAERVAFYRQVANKVYDGYIEADCTSGESILMKRLIHYLRSREARKHGQLPITDIPYCCL